MATYVIRQFGDPVLKQRSRAVEEIDGALARLVDTMYETMYDASGVGLAAPQVGVQRRLFTYDVGEGPEVLINPEIVESSGEWVFEEGCLSIPGYAFEVVRPRVVTVRGLDLDGNEKVFEADDYLGRVMQHELDHLDGVLMLDRVESDVRKQALRLMRERELLGEPPARHNGSPGL
ncbi:MAG TPA: peptide deformylase [Acidimicrobiia bacterium]|nr:peptide deformylase [Acidimicrobiia bacterium]